MLPTKREQAPAQVLLPTPPLPEPTRTTCCTPRSARFCAGGGGSFAADAMYLIIVAASEAGWAPSSARSILKARCLQAAGEARAPRRPTSASRRRVRDNLHQDLRHLRTRAWHHAPCSAAAPLRSKTRKHLHSCTAIARKPRQLDGHATSRPMRLRASSCAHLTAAFALVVRVPDLGSSVGQPVRVQRVKRHHPS